MNKELENPKNIDLLNQLTHPDLAVTDINSILCRLCANPNTRTIGIYSEEGLSNELSNKMNLYLPIKVSQDDMLPLHCCWSCASTVLAWHELVVVSVESDRRLRSVLQENNENKSDNIDINFESLEEATSPLVQEDRLDDSQPIFKDTADAEIKSCLKINLIDEVLKMDFNRRCETQKEQPSSQQTKTKRRCRSDITYNIFCDICHCGFTRKADMKKHKLLKHPNAIAIPSTTNKLAYVNEMAEDNLDGFKDQSSTKIDQLPNKLLRKSEVRFRRLKSEIIAEHFCDLCDKGFTRKFDMLKHRKSKHSNHELQTVQKPSQLVQRYKITLDGNQSYYKCEHCGQLFRQSYNFMRHQRIHTGVRPYICHICGKDFRTCSGLTRHITEHHYRIKKFKCDICGKSFAAKASRDEHRNIHTDNRPFVCNICGKTFRQKASLHTHMLFHTNNFRFFCNMCNKKFRRATELKIHSLLHTGSKPHECTLCSSKFRLRQDLKRHLKIHEKSREYICHECGSKFKQERYLKNHKKANHKGVK